MLIPPVSDAQVQLVHGHYQQQMMYILFVIYPHTIIQLSELVVLLLVGFVYNVGCCQVVVVQEMGEQLLAAVQVYGIFIGYAQFYIRIACVSDLLYLQLLKMLADSVPTIFSIIQDVANKSVDLLPIALLACSQQHHPPKYSLPVIFPIILPANILHQLQCSYSSQCAVDIIPHMQDGYLVTPAWAGWGEQLVVDIGVADGCCQLFQPEWEFVVQGLIGLGWILYALQYLLLCMIFGYSISECNNGSICPYSLYIHGQKLNQPHHHPTGSSISDKNQ